MRCVNNTVLSAYYDNLKEVLSQLHLFNWVREYIESRSVVSNHAFVTRHSAVHFDICDRKQSHVCTCVVLPALIAEIVRR